MQSVPIVPKKAAQTLAAQVGYVAAAIVIAWFYLWTVDPEWNRPALEKEGLGYYSLLTRGFLKGQTALDREVDPALAAVKDPYNPAERAGRGLHDASYYRGRYFIYFGVTPALTVFAPVKLLTGKFLDERFAIAGFAIGGFWLSAVLLLHIRRRCFPAAPVWVALAGVIVLGLATMVPPLLRRPSIWEVPIAAAYAFFMLTLMCVWRASMAKRGSWIWLAAGSLAMGLTVGARPTYLPAVVVLLVPLMIRASEWRKNEWRQLAIAALIPVMLAGAGLAIYNFVRFGRFAEFGQTYQMAGEDVRALKLFSLGYLPYNFRIYLLSAAGLSPFFPFITVIEPPPAPGGHFGIEDPYGLLPCMPWMIFAGAAALAAMRTGASCALRWFVLGTLGAVLATMGVVFCFGGACGRYMVDFTPGLALLAGVGAFGVLGRTRDWGRALAGLIAGILAVWSAGFGVLASFQHNALLQVENPAVYRRLATAFNRPVYWWDRLRGTEYGPIELDLIFPTGAVGEVEPLVVTGRSFRSDYLYVHYLSKDTVRFGYEHTSYGGATGEPIKIKPGQMQTVRIEMGSLYPPAAHPYFSTMPDIDARMCQRTIAVSVDRVSAFLKYDVPYDAVARRPDIGTAAGRSWLKRPFSGKIIAMRVVPNATPAANPFGAIRMELTRPPFNGVRSEPLVCSGETGRGDLVYIKYLSAHTVAFGYDHWAYGGFETDPVDFEPGTKQIVEVDFGALHPQDSKPVERVTIKLNNATVVDRPAAFYPCAPGTITVGTNSIGASTAVAAFSGDLVGLRRGAP